MIPAAKGSSPSITALAGPLAYERRAVRELDNVFRDGKHIVVARNANIAQGCFRCGQPSDGRPIRKCLWRNNTSSSKSASGVNRVLAASVVILYVLTAVLEKPILYSLSSFALIAQLFVEWRASRRRTITYGLCPAHKRLRQMLLSTSWALTGWGVMALAAGTWLLATQRGHSAAIGVWISSPACLLGAAVTWCFLPGPLLVKERDGLLWLRGSGEAFRLAQKPYVGPEAIAANGQALPDSHQ